MSQHAKMTRDLERRRVGRILDLKAEQAMTGVARKSSKGGKENLANV